MEVKHGVYVRGEIVARSRNDCGNATTRSLSVVDLHVAVSITTAFNVAMEAQYYVVMLEIETCLGLNLKCPILYDFSQI